MNKQYANYGADALGVVLTALQTQEVFQIISLILTIIATLFSLAFTIYNWWKKAKEDGKVTIAEIKDLKNLTEEDIKKLKELSK